MIWWILFGLVYFGIGAFCGAAAVSIGFKQPVRGWQFLKLLVLENLKIFAFFFFLWFPFFMWAATVTGIDRYRRNRALKQLDAAAND